LEGGQPIESWCKAIGLVARWITAERCDIKRGVIEQVFQLPCQFRAVLGSRRRRHAPQI